MTDLLNTELVNDYLQKFDPALQATLVALEKEPDEDHLEGFSSPCKMPVRCFIPIRFTARSRRATLSFKLWSHTWWKTSSTAIFKLRKSKTR